MYCILNPTSEFTSWSICGLPDVVGVFSLDPSSFEFASPPNLDETSPVADISIVLPLPETPTPATPTLPSTYTPAPNDSVVSLYSFFPASINTFFSALRVISFPLSKPALTAFILPFLATTVILSPASMLLPFDREDFFSVLLWDPPITWNLPSYEFCFISSLPSKIFTSFSATKTVFPEDENLLPVTFIFSPAVTLKSPSVSILLPFDKELFWLTPLHFSVYRPFSILLLLVFLSIRETSLESDILTSFFAVKFIPPLFLFSSEVAFFVLKELPFIFIDSSAFTLIFDPDILDPFDLAVILTSLLWFAWSLCVYFASEDTVYISSIFTLPPAFRFILPASPSIISLESFLNSSI